MPQFDVYPIRHGGLAVDCQADLLDDLATRFCVPLRQVEITRNPRLTPLIDFDGKQLTLLTPLARGIGRRDLERRVGNIAAYEYEIKAALDMLISGF